MNHNRVKKAFISLLCCKTNTVKGDVCFILKTATGCPLHFFFFVDKYISAKNGENRSDRKRSSDREQPRHEAAPLFVSCRRYLCLGGLICDRHTSWAQIETIGTRELEMEWHISLRVDFFLNLVLWSSHQLLVRAHFYPLWCPPVTGWLLPADSLNHGSSHKPSKCCEVVELGRFVAAEVRVGSDSSTLHHLPSCQEKARCVSPALETASLQL